MAHYQKVLCIKWKLAVPQAGQSVRFRVQPAMSGENLASLQAELQVPRHRCVVCQSPAFKAVLYNHDLVNSMLKLCNGDRSLKYKKTPTYQAKKSPTNNSFKQTKSKRTQMSNNNQSKIYRNLEKIQLAKQ